MAFNEIDKKRGGRRTGSPVRATTNGISMSITISENLAAQIGAKAFARLLLGSGKDDGFLAVIPQDGDGENTYVLGRYGKMKCLRLSIGLGAIRLPKANFKPVSLPHEVTKDGLVIDIRPLRKPALVAA